MIWLGWSIYKRCFDLVVLVFFGARYDSRSGMTFHDATVVCKASDRHRFIYVVRYYCVNSVRNVN